MDNLLRIIIDYLSQQFREAARVAGWGEKIKILNV
jgi:hypothetical protein